MSADSIKTMISMIAYLLFMVGIGVFYAKRSNEDSESYYIGGRSLGPFVAAMSAEASDMSGWLLMGLPGVAYWCGLADAAWTAVGLAIGTYINWKIVSKPLRRYSEIADNAITIPEFFSKRFHEKKNVLLVLAAMMIVIFFTVYSASCFVTAGKLFNAVFGFNYQLMVFFGAFIVVAYTLMGGFLAESVSDFVQGIVMIIALVAVLIGGIIHAGGIGAVLDNIKNIPGFFDFFQIATPQLSEAGKQISQDGVPLFGAAAPYAFLTILSTLSWGLGYFGMPQVLLRFMAIRRVDELGRARITAVTWCVISLIAAVLIGIIGRTIFPVAFDTAGGAENIFSMLSALLFHPLFAGIIMAGILAATMSSSDSYLLIASSAISRNLFKGVLKKDATDAQIMLVGKITLLAIMMVGILIALDENSVIFEIVSFAWSGFGATFGPLMLFSIFWKRTTHTGAVAGMLTGFATVFVWKLALKPLGGVFGIYELLPAFLLSTIVIVVVSLSTPKPSAEIYKEFEYAHMKGGHIKFKEDNKTA
ncbi:MAG: sodium/proline symporter PutP [Clostridiales Family XIII bacterium]|nr:sodium/proline symporter PutP [Clostridiales Family XIII bacterium]